MKDKILSILSILEKKHNITILYACESGSRAWGFESIDSDYDVRFVYVRNPDKYLTVFPDKELHIDGNNSKVCKSFERHNLDFVGWDIKKILYHFSKGNPDMISWFFSPIIYYVETDTLEELRKLGTKFFKQKAAYYHYMHMAEKNYNQYIYNPTNYTVRLKKYLYVLRPIIACMWIEMYNTEPPMVFENIYNNQFIRPMLEVEGVYDTLIALISDKRKGIELGEQPRLPILDKFCEAKLKYYKSIVGDSKVIDVTKKEHEELDSIFRNILTKG